MKWLPFSRVNTWNPWMTDFQTIFLFFTCAYLPLKPSFTSFSPVLVFEKAVQNPPWPKVFFTLNQDSNFPTDLTCLVSAQQPNWSFENGTAHIALCSESSIAVHVSVKAKSKVLRLPRAPSHPTSWSLTSSPPPLFSAHLSWVVPETNPPPVLFSFTAPSAENAVLPGSCVIYSSTLLGLDTDMPLEVKSSPPSLAILLETASPPSHMNFLSPLSCSPSSMSLL